MKKYVLFEDLNEEERKYNRISYKRLVNRLFDDMILCNEIARVRYDNMEVVAGSDYDEETEEYKEIYQYFIVDGHFNEDLLQEVGDELGVVYYDNELDIYILGVDHYGTGWDYVMTDIEPTENIDEADL